ncbi:MAG: glycerol-3-phosphate dehydrogenase/oxidase [Myxococcales bacterium]|nr:glycerol-3-phosphate dehydrogenase/oxidase [Myxococcales bacterium]
MIAGGEGWDRDHRARAFAGLSRAWDIIVVGGGITGAGIALEAARLGLAVLLVEQADFARGASSRSSKLVHGGLRYLSQGKFKLTRDSVREREELLRIAPGLVIPQHFLIAVYKVDGMRRQMVKVGLHIYDWMSGIHSTEVLSPEEVLARVPILGAEGLAEGFEYRDAQTDDARLVLRVLSDAARAGATTLNYARAVEPVLEDGRVRGLTIVDEVTGARAQARSRVVINATGPWADRLRGALELPPKMRPLRGSHLVFSRERVPLDYPLSLYHHVDRRPIVIYPWEGATVVGTTDLDHEGELDVDPSISGPEVSYLLGEMTRVFPSLQLGLDDIISTYAGVRPVIGTGQRDPSKESRDHAVWDEHGLLTVTGGKLTTFRLIAVDAVHTALAALGEEYPVDGALPDHPILTEVDPAPLARALEGVAVEDAARERLLGRHGAAAASLVEHARAVGDPDELTAVPGTAFLWAELRWAAGREQVVHLDDLLLRRTRIGNVCPGGGAELLPRVRAVCQAELGWDDARWEEEEAAYRALWRRHHWLPARDQIPALDVDA